MNTRFSFLGAILFVMALACTQPGGTFAAHTLVGNSVDVFHLQQNTDTGMTTPPITPLADSLFRDVPSLSGRYATGNRTFLPYIGAGFNAGYNSELDRTFAPSIQPQQNLNFGGPQGQRVVPNEFQLGIRIPF